MNVKKTLELTALLRERCGDLSIGGRVTTVYNPLEYAWEPYKLYLQRYGMPPKKTVFLGMNPGPWGMAQTGVPFGEIAAVRDWLGIQAKVGTPENEIEKRPVSGFECSRSEVSGRRVWGLMRNRFGTPEKFFNNHFIANYCPLLFFDKEGKNLTPDKLSKEDREKVFTICDEYLREIIEFLNPKYLIGFGKFAESRLKTVTERMERGRDRFTVIGVLHPSPANPRANKGWEKQVTEALITAGVWR